MNKKAYQFFTHDGDEFIVIGTSLDDAVISLSWASETEDAVSQDDISSVIFLGEIRDVPRGGK